MQAKYCASDVTTDQLNFVINLSNLILVEGIDAIDITTISWEDAPPE